MLCLCPLCLEPAACHQFCPECANTLMASGHCCQQCAEPMAWGMRFCRGCVELRAPWERLSVVAAFASPWSDLIKQLKYRNQLNLVAPMAHLLAQRIVSHRSFNTEVTWRLVALPMHSQRLQARGFNQAALLAQALGKSLRLAYAQPLWRIQHTEALESLTRSQRQQAVANAFACEPIRGAWILVDDVFTTGASMTAATKALRLAGANRVWLATLAKTPNYWR